MRRLSAATLLAPLALSLAALGCGGNKPAEQAAVTATPSPESLPVVDPTPAPLEAAPPAAEPTRPRPTAAPYQQPPRSEPLVKTLPVGTEIQAALETPASSATSQVGDAVRARTTQPLSFDGVTVIPEGATVVGTITEAVPVKKIGGAASLGIRFDAVELPGQTVVIDASVQEKAKSQTGKDAGTIAGATVGGALLGRLLSKHDKTKGTIIGAAVGAAAGTGAAVATKGKEVEFAAGTPFVLKLESETNVTVRR